ncbi:MAG: glycine oxidase ThiO [Acidobacteriota bacterium]|nr:glycine oxidase ThiO [Acidobacteriota bacterium]
MGELLATADVVVVGGGVIGLVIARALSLRGLHDVLLIERNSLGAEASFAAAGMLAPQAEADCADEFFYLACGSRDMYPAFAAALREESGIDVELETTGTLYLAFTEHDVNEVEKRYQWQSEAGLVVERLTADAARSLEPAISEKIRSALKFPLDVQVENRRLVKALAVSNERCGVRMVTDTTVESLRIDRSRVSGVETSRGSVATEKVVIANGAWASVVKAADKALPDLRIEPVRGQMLSFAASPPVICHVVYSPRGYIVPRSDGRLLAGSTTEEVGFDKRVTDQGIHSIMTAAAEISPSVMCLPVSASWAGLRPRAADDLPVLGPCAEIEGVWYATGHYRNGILLAPITGELIAEAIVDKVVPPMLSSFSPDRFGLVSVN